MVRAELTAYVLGGGGVLGSSEVGMVRALAERGVRPDLVLGTSIGALNGAFIAADPGLEGAERLAAVWEAVVREGVFLDSPMRQAARVARYRTHLLSNAPLRHLVERYLPVSRFEDLEVAFQCVAACIEDSSGRWFVRGRPHGCRRRVVLGAGPLPARCGSATATTSTAASCTRSPSAGPWPSARPGSSCSRWAGSSSRCGPRPSRGRSRPWRSRSPGGTASSHEMESVPDDVEMHVLPSGSTASPNISIGQARIGRMRERMEAARAASAAYLTALEGP